MKHKVNNHKIIKCISKSKLGSLTDRSIKNSLPEGFYSSRRIDIAHIEPKVFEPFINSAGKAPRKVIIDRKVKEFNDLEVEAELRKYNIDFSSEIRNKENIIKLEFFDNTDYEVRKPMDWINLATENGQIKGIPAYACKFENNIGKFL